MEFDWKKVSIEDYAKLTALAMQQPVDVLEQLDREVAALSLLTGKPVDYYEDLQYEDLIPAIAAMRRFISKPFNERFRPRIFISNRLFKIDPKYPNTAGHYFRLEDLCVTPETFADKCPEILAIIYKEKKMSPFRKRLTRAECVRAFRSEATAADAIAVACFFGMAANELLVPLMLYAEKEKQKQEQKADA